jgi:hypothetical protein
MLEIIVLYFGITYVATLILGYLQSPPEELQEVTRNEVYGKIALAAICLQAIVSIASLGGTNKFPYAAIFVAFTLLSHHTVIHRQSRFEGEVYSCAAFQLKDISNHETWVVASIVAAVVSATHV